MDAQNAFDAAGWKSHALPGHMGQIGPLLSRKTDDGQRCYALQLDARHLNPAGMVHGGVLLSLADHAASAVAWELSQRQPCVTLQLDSQFISPAHAGDLLQAQVTVLQKTSSLVFVRVDVCVAQRKVLAAQAILKVLRTPTPEPAIKEMPHA